MEIILCGFHYMWMGGLAGSIASSPGNHHQQVGLAISNLSFKAEAFLVMEVRVLQT